jgi:nitrite reductase/ring-hydroxylating ferredoxin subunit
MSDARFLLACNRSDVEPGCVRCFEIDGHQIAIYNIDERFYATDDICTHGLSSLSTGELQGDTIECAAHFGVFHVPTGKVMGLPCAVPLRTYRVALQDEGVFVEI